MMAKYNVFEFEHRIDELFETLYPAFKSGESGHPSGRAYRPLIEFSLGAMVPDGNNSRRLQKQREYVKVDFADFIDYATSQLPPQPRLSDYPDQTAIFYDSIASDTGTHWAVWGAHTFAIKDAVVVRDRIFVTVIMRFAVCFNWKDGTTGTEEVGTTITFAPESYSPKTKIAGPLGEWERATWLPPVKEDDEFRFTNSGEFTSYRLEEMENKPNPPFSSDSIAKIREGSEANHAQWGAFFEVARLGLYLSSYVDFMYDLVVTERRPVGAKSSKNRQPRRGKPVSFDRPVYKIIRSVRIIRPESPPVQQAELRQWTAPKYSFIVRGHWRHFDDTGRAGRDAEGNAVVGKTWVREHRKFEEQGESPSDSHVETRDPRVVIGIKQTLGYARDVVEAYSGQNQPAAEKMPSPEWMADERAKLTAGLRYLILKRDGFRCRKCGKSQVEENYVRLEVDHKIPISQWGRTVEDNLETLCRDCNRGKSDDA